MRFAALTLVLGVLAGSSLPHIQRAEAKVAVVQVPNGQGGAPYNEGQENGHTVWVQNGAAKVLSYGVATVHN
ncbi:hypothetical protein BH11PAT4_BH11PAT4_8490 [soil metagenome]